MKAVVLSGTVSSAANDTSTTNRLQVYRCVVVME